MLLLQAHNNLGLVYIAEGQYDQALACFEAAIACDQNLACANSNRLRLQALMAANASEPAKSPPEKQ